MQFDPVGLAIGSRNSESRRKRRRGEGREEKELKPKSSCTISFLFSSVFRFSHFLFIIIWNFIRSVQNAPVDPRKAIVTMARGCAIGWSAAPSPDEIFLYKYPPDHKINSSRPRVCRESKKPNHNWLKKKFRFVGYYINSSDFFRYKTT